MEDGTQCNPRSVEGVFNDFNARRDALTGPVRVAESHLNVSTGRPCALIKALTTDFDEFFKQCDPQKGNLCLFGFPSRNWEVNVPAEQLPSDLPEPALGINFARDMMQEQDWVALVAARSDAWFSVAHYFGAKFGFGQSDRKQLLDMMNELPTVFETVFDTRRQQGKEKASSSNNGRSKSKSSSKGKQQSEPKGKRPKTTHKKEEDDGTVAEEGGEEDNRVSCGYCGENYTSDEFWISCHFCEKWFHGKCLKITPAKAEYIKQYKCPGCRRNKRSQP